VGVKVLLLCWRRVSSEPLLYQAYPHLRGVLPHLRLGRFPTRVHRVEGLAPPPVELWVKRDDESGELYGGNKVRKLEWIIGEARERGARRLATIGAIGSHHVLATAIYGRQQGLEVEAVVFPQPLTEHVREQMLADVASGASLRPTAGWLGVPLAVWRARRPAGTAWVSPGGSSATGSLGYVEAALELEAQIAAGELPRPDVVYVALGSCGTAAGLLCGLRGRQAPELVAVRVVDRVACNAGVVRSLVGEITFEKLFFGMRARLAPLPPWRVEHRFFGGAYGRSTAESEQAVARAADAGLRLEPTYTGKTMAALLADAAAGRLDGKRVLYWHTYNGVDLAPLLATGPGASALPPPLRRHFGNG
jgi:1-aminocyclopropane-1-carboxylate deaminase/D-cysteine desulfhydrase-like pyridoxal-dependent ACC family enzyme